MKITHLLRTMADQVRNADFAAASATLGVIADKKHNRRVDEQSEYDIYFSQLRNGSAFTIEPTYGNRWQLFINGQLGHAYDNMADLAYDMSKAINPLQVNILDHSIDDNIKYVVAFKNNESSYTLTLNFVRDINGRNLRVDDRRKMNYSLAKSFVNSLKLA